MRTFGMFILSLPRTHARTHAFHRSSACIMVGYETCQKIYDKTIYVYVQKTIHM